MERRELVLHLLTDQRTRNDLYLPSDIERRELVLHLSTDQRTPNGFVFIQVRVAQYHAVNTKQFRVPCFVNTKQVRVARCQW